MYFAITKGLVHDLTHCGLGDFNEVLDEYFSRHRMAWQWAETLVEIRGTLADIRGNYKIGVRMEFSQTGMNLTGLYV